jgi:RNA polymerase sigma-70 factor (ECF subfamily)
LRAQWSAGDHEATATLWIQALGPEILSFLAALPIRGVDHEDVFAHFCEALWRSLPTLRWDCSARTWSYLLARSSWQRAVRSARRHARVPLSNAPEVARAVAAVRSSTGIHCRTEVKDRFRELREELAEDDRMLLVLRVDRGLDWSEAARVMAGNATLDAAAIAKESARLRKQFQRLKDRIRVLAEQRGLLGERSD